MDKKSRILILGSTGMVGGSIVRQLKKLEYSNLLLPDEFMLDLTNQESVMRYFRENEPEYVFLAAAKVGGIYANSTQQADFGYINGMIELNIIYAAYKFKVKKLLFLGSSCIYPRDCPQPIKEEYLLTGKLEQTNEMYALAKILGLKLCEAYNLQYKTNFISCMPTNLYGINDNFDLQNSHVLPALIRKFHEARAENKSQVEVWGTGKPRREFLFVDDLADACVFLMNNYNSNDTINVGCGFDVTIKELAETIKDITGFSGDIHWNIEKPDGTPRKILDVSRINEIGWKARTGLREGLEITYKWFIDNQDKIRK
ncbi:MAG: GDP-L-fucose synthase [Candidatus Coatesbacteria bacterium]|nr:GDP-L-fucose synthase [Candidatus Coatesbacteria bacterium]